MSDATGRSVEVRMELRVTLSCDTSELARLLGIVREAGGRIDAHLVYRLEERSSALIVCESPAEAALALRSRGYDVQTETIVAVETEERPGALIHLLETLAAERVDIGYSYATSCGDRLLVVLRTGDNPRADAALRQYLRVE